MSFLSQMDCLKYYPLSLTCFLGEAGTVQYVSHFLREWCSISDSFTSVKLEITSTYVGEEKMWLPGEWFMWPVNLRVKCLNWGRGVLHYFRSPHPSINTCYLQPIKHLDENIVFLYLLNMYIGPFDK